MDQAIGQGNTEGRVRRFVFIFRFRDITYGRNILVIMYPKYEKNCTLRYCYECQRRVSLRIPENRLFRWQTQNTAHPVFLSGCRSNPYSSGMRSTPGLKTTARAPADWDRAPRMYCSWAKFITNCKPEVVRTDYHVKVTFGKTYEKNSMLC